MLVYQNRRPEPELTVSRLLPSLISTGQTVRETYITTNSMCMTSTITADAQTSASLFTENRCLGWICVKWWLKLPASKLNLKMLKAMRWATRLILPGRLYSYLQPKMWLHGGDQGWQSVPSLRGYNVRFGVRMGRYGFWTRMCWKLCSLLKKP